MGLPTKKVEVFVGCRSLDGCKATSLDFFAVLYQRDGDDNEFEETARTETICNNDSPQFCTSFELSYQESSAAQIGVRVDVYQRKTLDTERLRDHFYVGKFTTSVHDILVAPGNHITSQVSHPTEERNMGILTLNAEQIDTENEENESDVLLDVSAFILRRRDLKKTIYGQRFELRRAHLNDDGAGNTIWLPVYRSDRISRQRDSNCKIEFSSMSIRYRHLCNGDDSRRIRISMYASSSGSKHKCSEICVGASEFTVRDLCELDPTVEVLQLGKFSSGELEEVGHVAITKAEPTDFGSHFALQINYEDTEKYTAASSIEKRALKIRKKLSRQSLPKRLSMNGRNGPSGSKKPLIASAVDALFSNSFNSPELP